MSERKILTDEQKQIQREFVEIYGLEPAQISFEGSEPNPILDYEAVNALSLKLTDIRDIETYISDRGEDFVKARCVVELPDGRTRRTEESAYLGELLGDGAKINTLRLAEQVAQARAARRGIRSAGINLFNAHKKFKESGEIAVGHINNDPRYPQYQEINVLAYKLGLKKKLPLGDKHVEDRTEYDKVLAENFEGRTSAKDLNDIELQRFILLLRTYWRLQTAGAVKQAA